MSTTATNKRRIYLKKARLEAGYVNRGTASTKVPFSPETIGRHERGEGTFQQDEAIIYAKCYGRDDILVKYCSECPIGTKLQKAIEERDLALATTRLSNRLYKAPKIAKKLQSIADDGRVNEWEKKDFIKLMRKGKEISAAFREIELWAYSTGIVTPEEIQKAAPDATGDGKHKI